MKIYLLRHAETEDNYVGKIQGRENALLNDTGKRQLVNLKMRKEINVDKCYTSPLTRCFETALILVGDKVKIEKDDRLIQREMGELTGREVLEYNAYQFWDYKLNRNDYGVESIKDLFKRCRSFLRSLEGDSILIVTHGEVYRALRHILLKHKIDGNLLDERINNCYLEEFIYKRSDSYEYFICL